MGGEEGSWLVQVPSLQGHPLQVLRTSCGSSAPGDALQVSAQLVTEINPESFSKALASVFLFMLTC